MAEINDAPPEDQIKDSDRKSESSKFDPETMRKTKPGLKRLVLTLSVFLSFLLGLPLLLKSVEIYRSPLPFKDIDSLSSAIESSTILFPCHFQALFVNIPATLSSSSNQQLEYSIYSRMQKLFPTTPPCGTCSNFSVSVTLEPQLLNGLSRDRNSPDFDDYLDDYLDAVLNKQFNSEEKVYRVVVVNRDEVEQLRAVVGKYRHAWIEGMISNGDYEMAMVERIAEIFVKVFVNGAKEEGTIHGEFMPVGADGKLVLSFNLLNADPRDWVYDWDFQQIDDILLAPIVEALKPLADVSVESQVLYHTPKSSFSYWDEKQASHVFSSRDLPFFVNSNEWHLDTSTAAGGRSKVLQFVVYIPSSGECPLSLQLPDGQFSLANGFISPMWGGVVVWNSPACLTVSESNKPLIHKMSSEDLKNTFEVFTGQLRQLFGLKSNSFFTGASGTVILLPSERGFTQWELDVLSRQHTCFNLLQCGTTLGSLSRLVQSLPRMIIRDEIGKQVKYSLDAAKLTLGNASLGIYDTASESSRLARSLAEDAFYDPSMMSVSYYSFEHCFAVYSPFFLPVSLHVVLAVLREWKRYKQEQKKFAAWKSVGI
ncbi:OLC1v1006764C1 [Oldenlandia corymbosa var. corymbosa]|uniref:OLC1v1006764C1 n=1 Tax=Oldenlandia corymbosa var. corymbosa TaxID=529605 RepID=A0AAV1DK68_OLDCO|nr:OLC1v1006764C1 [Oldenlandia corymbosa var. corymbosa]